MRSLLLTPLLAAALALAGFFLCRAAGFNPHTHELLAAALLSCFAALAGISPAVVLRSSSQVVLTQAGLAGTVIQLMLTLLLAVAAAVFHLAGDTSPFSLWLLAFYWAMLLANVVVIVSLIRHAKPDPTKPAAVSSASAPA